MGKKARKKRKAVKAEARAKGLHKGDEKKWMPPPHTPMGFVIDELGELRRVVSKAEARSRFLRSFERRKRIHTQAMHEIIELACQRAKEDIQLMEDARVFNMMGEAIGAL